eukprot:GHVU01233063.1.p1 GENE.GHVU01233063.1~~GHVU01233063.1.p1  ORF type:complete len:185 (+),score=12.05 GHVU01233063.1:371-925(+)
MKDIIGESNNEEVKRSFKSSKGWRQNLCRRYRIVWRRRTNAKNRTALERWTLKQRWNVDQIPISLDAGVDNSYNEIGGKTVAIRGRKNAHKSFTRLCTCQLIVRLDGEVVEIVVVFRGTGKTIAISERQAYHPSIRVHFQPKGYYDNEEFLRWATDDLPTYMEGQSGPHLLFSLRNYDILSADR